MPASPAASIDVAKATSCILSDEKCGGQNVPKPTADRMSALRLCDSWRLQSATPANLSDPCRDQESGRTDAESFKALDFRHPERIGISFATPGN
jgi:hypothetical protein